MTDEAVVDGLDVVADELYGGDPADFVRVRTERAAAAKSAGDRDLARRIAALRKPTTAAAVVNDLVRRNPEQLAELAELGRRLREATTGLTGPELREVATRRGELIGALLDALPADRRDTAREVETTLGALLADADVAGTVLAGRLARTPDPVADLNWLAAAVPAGPSSPRQADAAARRAATPGTNDTADRAVDEAEERHRMAARNLARAHERVDEVDEELRTLTEQLNAARRKRESAQQDLRRAETEHRQAETALEQARTERDAD